MNYSYSLFYLPVSQDSTPDQLNSPVEFVQRLEVKGQSPPPSVIEKDSTNIL